MPSWQVRGWRPNRRRSASSLAGAISAIQPLPRAPAVSIQGPRRHHEAPRTCTAGVTLSARAASRFAAMAEAWSAGEPAPRVREEGAAAYAEPLLHAPQGGGRGEGRRRCRPSTRWCGVRPDGGCAAAACMPPCKALLAQAGRPAPRATPAAASERASIRRCVALCCAVLHPAHLPMERPLPSRPPIWPRRRDTSPVSREMVSWQKERGGGGGGGGGGMGVKLMGGVGRATGRPGSPSAGSRRAVHRVYTQQARRECACRLPWHLTWRSAMLFWISSSMDCSVAKSCRQAGRQAGGGERWQSGAADQQHKPRGPSRMFLAHLLWSSPAKQCAPGLAP